MADSDVAYTLKEVIEKLDRKLDAMFTVLSSKADRTELNALDHRVGTLEETVRADRTARSALHEARVEWRERWRWLVPVLISLASALLVLLHF